jgi:hypothetical protein
LKEAPIEVLLIFSSPRNEYVELDPNELGFQLGDVMEARNRLSNGWKENTHPISSKRVTENNKTGDSC